MNSVPSNHPILFIPRVFQNIGEQRIKDVLEELQLGVVARVDLVQRSNEQGDKFNRAYIHFKSWNPDTQKARDRLLAGKEIKIIYDDPWFWKVTAYVNKKPAPKPVEKKIPRISYDDDGDEYGRNIARPISPISPLSPHTPKGSPPALQNPDHIKGDPAYNEINVNYGSSIIPKKKAPRKSSASIPVASHC